MNFDNNNTIKSSVEIPFLIIDLGDVFNEILLLKDNLSGGPDGISAYFITRCAYSLSKPLCMIFKQSLKSAIFPDR